LTKNEVVLTQKIVTKLMVWILDWDPGVKKAPDPGSVSATMATGTYFFCTGRSKAQGEASSHPESFTKHACGSDFLSWDISWIRIRNTAF
jgi:hypothetical protein